MLIEKSGLSQNTLAGKTVIVTGGGGGIGFEAARALVWLGANVIIAEIDAEKGKAAQSAINKEMGCGRAEFYRIDLSDASQIEALVSYAKSKYGFIDAVFNNATIAPLGAADKIPASEWDKSYAVNLRAPLLLAQKLLPDMKAKNRGAIIFVSSSGAAPYMGAYEVFKTAQVELSNTLAGELEDTGIHALTIGPGLVKTDTAKRGIEEIASLMGMTLDDFYKRNEAYMLDPEEAGVGFALAVVSAEKYRGQEVSSIQVLSDANIFAGGTAQRCENEEASARLKTLVPKAARTYYEQYDGWMNRNLFERQWVLRDFKKYTGYSAEQFRARIREIEDAAAASGGLYPYKSDFEKLGKYYKRQYELLQGFERDSQKLKENSQAIKGWIKDIEDICALL